MRAQVIRRFGPPSVFELADLPDPVPGPGQVLVRQRASSAGWADARIRAGQAMALPSLPAVLGTDVAGTVERLGRGVTGFRAGDPVFGCAGGPEGLFGAYAERVVVDSRLLAPAPGAIELVCAAALPQIVLAAADALDRAGVGAATSVLVHAGSTAAGHVAIQLALARGARVVASVGAPEEASIVARAGVEEAVDHNIEATEDYVGRLTGGRGFDLVFDASGGEELDMVCAAAAPGGHVATLRSDYACDLSALEAGGLTLHVVAPLAAIGGGRAGPRHAAALRLAAELVDRDRLRLPLDEPVLPLERLAEAQARAEQGRLFGQVVVEIGV